MTPYDIVRVAHIGLGGLAFVVLPVPLAARKGGKAHVSFGRIYVYAMGGLALTGVPLAARGLFSDDPRRQGSALFLFFIALLASDNAWLGVRVIRASRKAASQRRLLDVAPPVALLCAAAGLLVLGASRGVALHVFFGLLGGLISVGQISSWLRGPRSRAESVIRHIGGMGVSCITTLTAFLVTNAQHVFGLRAFNIVVWVTPTVLGAFAIARAQRAWRARLSAPTPARGDVSA